MGRRVGFSLRITVRKHDAVRLYIAVADTDD
jgi:hypothetical protein